MFIVTTLMGGKREKVVEQEFGNAAPALAAAVNEASRFSKEAFAKNLGKNIEISVEGGEYEHDIWRVWVYCSTRPMVFGRQIFVELKK